MLTKSRFVLVEVQTVWDSEHQNQSLCNVRLVTEYKLYVEKWFFVLLSFCIWLIADLLSCFLFVDKLLDKSAKMSKVM